MIFRQWREVLSGAKTQTRRLVRPDEKYHSYLGEVQVPSPRHAFGWRAKWAVGKTYAVQPGRGKPAVGRIRITAIRQERVQEITTQDALAEGVGHDYINAGGTTGLAGLLACKFVIEEYAGLWDSIYTASGTRWADNPLVWVLVFELVEGSQS